MDFLDVLRLLRRRIAILVLGAILTAGAAALALVATETQHQARAEYILLLPADSTGENNPTNPYINLNAGLVFAAGLIGSDLTTNEMARSLQEAGFESDYSIALAPSGGPQLQVLVEGSDPEDVLATRDRLLERSDEKLSTLQDIPGIPPNQNIFSTTNAVDPGAEVVPGSKRQALTIVGLVGVVATLVAAFVVDGLARRRLGAPGVRP